MEENEKKQTNQIKRKRNPKSKEIAEKTWLNQKQVVLRKKPDKKNKKMEKRW